MTKQMGKLKPKSKLAWAVNLLLLCLAVICYLAANSVEEPIKGLLYNLATELLGAFLVFVIFNLIFNISQEEEVIDALHELQRTISGTGLPIELVKGHDNTEKLYRSLAQKAQRELLVVGLGMDLSASGWRNEIDDFLEIYRQRIKEGLLFRRWQILQNASIRWLEFQLELLRLSTPRRNFDLMFLKGDEDFHILRFFQVYIIDDSEAALFVNTETGATKDDSFAIVIRGREAVELVRRHVLKVARASGIAYDEHGLAQLIEQLTEKRFRAAREKAADVLGASASGQQAHSNALASIVEFSKICPDVPDEFVLEETLRQVRLLQKEIGEISKSDKSVLINKIAEWRSAQSRRPTSSTPGGRV